MENNIGFKNKWTEQLLDNNHIGILVVDSQRKNLYVNNYLCELFGYTQNELLNANTTIFHISEESFLEFGKIAFETALKGGSIHVDYQVKKSDGTLFWIHISGDLVLGQKEIIWIISDITERKKTELELEEASYNMQQYLEVVDKIDIGIFVVDDDFNVRYMNNTMVKWFGNQTNKTCYSAVAGLDKPCPYCKLEDVIYKNSKVMYEPETPDGQSFEIVAASIKNSDGTTSKMEVIRNVTEKKLAQKYLVEQQEKMDYLANHDSLTGLANRVLFNDRLEQGMKKAKRNETSLALLFIDLDRFKEINDSLGHGIGDKVLQIVTTTLESVIRAEDSLARLGGDEFTIIIEDISSVADISSFAQKILDVLAQPLEIDGNTLYISSSIGISLFPNDGDTLQDLLKFADSAMYRAKDKGRNTFQFYSSEMTEMAIQRVTMEASLRQAIKNKEFVVYYQPQINARVGTLTGMEALVRWQHPKEGLIAPYKFIPLAESTGLIVEIDRLVMYEAMQQFKEWYDEGLNPGVLSLNLAIKQLEKEDFIDFLRRTIHKVGCKCTNIALEVIESQIMNNPEESIKILKQISSLGIELAVDDFGTGYSSLSYLKKLPIDKLKIDQSFVKNLPDDEEDASIAKAVIALAKSLNLNIIAEGVEDSAQRDFMVENGCDNIQGYFYSKPIPAREMKEFLLTQVPELKEYAN